MVVWPALSDVAIKDETAVFTGWVHGPTGPATGRLLFAFHPPGPVIEITQKVLALKAKQLGQSLSEIPRFATIVTLKKMDDGIDLGIGSIGTDDNHFKLNWSEIDNFLRAGTINGTPHKDGLKGTPYLKLPP